MGNRQPTERETVVDIVERLNDGVRGSRISEIKEKTNQFSSTQLKSDIIAWMRKQISKDQKTTINFLKKREFDEIFIKLLEKLGSLLYGTIIHSIVWILESNKMDLSDDSLRKKVLQHFLKDELDENYGEKGQNYNQIGIFREFIDCWVSIHCDSILDYIIDFTMDKEDEINFDKSEIYKEKEKKVLKKQTAEVLDQLLSSKKIYNISYKKDCKYRSFSDSLGSQVKKLDFFLNQIEEESKTISNFLFELFWYIFNFINLKEDRESSQDDREEMKGVITRYMFSKDSNLLNLTLYLVRVLNSQDYDEFVDKKRKLNTMNDDEILEREIVYKLNQVDEINIEFKENISHIRKVLKTELIDKIKVPCRSFEDIVERAKTFAAQLKSLPDKDHYFIVFWVEIFYQWFNKSFNNNLEIENRIQMFYLIIKYIQSNEVLVFAIAVQILHRDRLENHQAFSLFLNTMREEFAFRKNCQQKQKNEEKPKSSGYLKLQLVAENMVQEDTEKGSGSGSALTRDEEIKENTGSMQGEAYCELKSNDNVDIVPDLKSHHTEY